MASARHITTVKKRSDFLKANRGWRWVSPAFILLVQPREDKTPHCRAGYTVTKKTGNAVVRNRIKRRLRALVDNILPEEGVEGADHIFIGRTIATHHDWVKMQTDLSAALSHYRKNPNQRPRRFKQRRRSPSTNAKAV